MSKGFDFENSLVSFFRSQGYLAKRGVPLIVENSQDATDIDVYGLKFTYPFIETNLVCDCKNKARPKPFERLFWTKGMAEYVKVDNVYVALPRVQTKVAKFAATLGVNILTKEKIELLESDLFSYGIFNDNLDKDKDKFLLGFYRKVKQLYIVKNPYNLFNACISNIEIIVKEKKNRDINECKKLDIILIESVVLLTISLLRMCNKVISLDQDGMVEEIRSKLTYGDIPESRANGIIDSVSRLAIEIIKNETGVIKYSIDDFNFIKPPNYAEDTIGLVNRIMSNPKVYIDLPQITDYMLFELIAKDKKIDRKIFNEIFGENLSDEKVKAFKNIIYFINRHLNTEINIDNIFI